MRSVPDAAPNRSTLPPQPSADNVALPLEIVTEKVPISRSFPSQRYCRRSFQ